MKKVFGIDFIRDCLDTDMSAEFNWSIPVSEMSKLVRAYCNDHKLEAPRVGVFRELMLNNGVRRRTKPLEIISQNLETGIDTPRRSTIRCWDGCRAKNTSGILDVRYENDNSASEVLVPANKISVCGGSVDSSVGVTKKRKKRKKSKKIRFRFRPVSPDADIYDFINRKVNINGDDNDIIKWVTSVKEMRDAYKVYFKTFSKIDISIRFVNVSKFNDLLWDLGLVRAVKRLTIRDESTKKYVTKQYLCWVGCKLVV